jgi:hypothetical protein
MCVHHLAAAGAAAGGYKAQGTLLFPEGCSSCTVPLVGMVYWQSLYTRRCWRPRLRRSKAITLDCAFELLLLLIHLQHPLLWDVCVAAAAVASLL